MYLKDLAEQFEMTAHDPDLDLEKEIARGYAGDLLSDVIAHAEEGDVWITLQVHMNIVAVASMKDLAGIILIGGRKPNQDTAEKASEEGIPILTSDLPAFELIGRLYAAGIPGV